MRPPSVRLRRMSLAAAALLICVSASPSFAEHFLEASATCVAGDSIRVNWTFFDTSEGPIVAPPWTGYDVLRRPLSDCGEFVRVNPTPFPWSPGYADNHVYTEAAPASGEMFQYQVILVDDNRELACAGYPFCTDMNWVSCPTFSAPITHGTLEDWGWALLIHPCPDGCYYSFYFERDLVEELRPLAGTGTAVKFYGEALCGGFEGCGLRIDHYEVADCGPVQALPETWGSVKARYR